MKHKIVLEEGDRLQLNYQGRAMGSFAVTSILFETALLHRDGDSFQIYVPKEYIDGKAEEFSINHFPKKAEAGETR